MAKKELIKHQEEVSKHQSKILEIKSAIEATEKKIREDDEKKLIKEKEKLELQKKCCHCGHVKDEKMHKTCFYEKFLCNTCFLTLDNKTLDQYLKV